MFLAGKKNENFLGGIKTKRKKRRFLPAINCVVASFFQFLTGLKSK